MNFLSRIRGHNTKRGFTVSELCICIIIIGIVALIAIPTYLSYRARACDIVARQNLKHCYTTSQIYFLKEPQSTVTQSILKDTGLKLSEGVTLIVLDGTQDNLSLCTEHRDGKKRYCLDSSGTITEQDKTKVRVAFGRQVKGHN